MADDYIDYWEVSEYAEHFLRRTKGLEGTQKLVDVALLRGEVEARAGRVAAELTRAGVKRSNKRGGSGNVEGAADKGRKTVERFWNHLGSLEDEIRHDVAAFFSGGKLGALASLKPADVKAKLKSVLDGFAVPDNAKIPDHTGWKTKLTNAYNDLVAALDGRTGAHGESIQATAQLVEARADFVAYYNGVAKPLVRGALNSIGRGAEYEQFFGDLLVNESSPRGPVAEEHKPVAEEHKPAPVAEEHKPAPVAEDK